MKTFFLLTLIFCASAQASINSYDFDGTPLSGPMPSVQNVSGPSVVIDPLGRSGNAAFYSGTVASTAPSFMYVNMFSVAIPVTSTTTLEYYIKPLFGTKSVSVNLLLDNNVLLSTSGLKDQTGTLADPKSQASRLTFGTWNQVSINLGALAGNTIRYIMVHYSSSSNPRGLFYGYVDDIKISTGSTAPVTYKGKVFSISPVEAQGGPVSSNVDNLRSSFVIPDVQNGILANADFRSTFISLLSPFTSTTVPNVGTTYDYSSVSSPNKLDDVNSYRQVSKLRTKAKTNKGWYLAGTDLKIVPLFDSFFSDIKNNAFYDSSNNSINFTATDSAYGNRHLALDGTVVVHEAGHGNTDKASSGQIYSKKNDVTCSDGLNRCCTSDQGCIGAIDEGQADVHSYFTHGIGAVGTYFENSTQGFDYRNAGNNASLTAQQMFSGSAYGLGVYGKEIHAMGAVYSAVWWTMRLTMSDTVVNKLFFAHIALLTGSDTFITAKEKIVLLDKQLYRTSSHEKAIRAAFSKHGL